MYLHKINEYEDTERQVFESYMDKECVYLVNFMNFLRAPERTTTEVYIALFIDYLEYK